MSVNRLSNSFLVQFLIFLLLMTSASSLVFAKANKEVTPKYAHAQTYGSGWSCDLGFQKQGEICVAVKVPENAYLTNSSFGNGWKCGRGYRKSYETCVAIKIPTNAYLNSYGHDWQCNRGFKAHNEACVKIKIPDNGYFVDSSYGKGWECDRGYLEEDDSCVILNVPVNAHIDYSGHDWDCNPPYSKLKNKCELSQGNN